MSRVLTPAELRASLAVFGVIYLLLLAVWLFTLNDQIQRGPEAGHVHDTGAAERLVEVAAARPAHVGSLADGSAHGRKLSRRRSVEGEP